MRAAAFSSYGPPEVLRVMEFDDPQAGAGQVRVRVKAAGIQPFDCAVRSSGWTQLGLTVSFPQILGNEFAGVIDQVGEDVTGFSIGDEVLGWALMACYAEYVVVSVNQIVQKPPEMPWEEAGVMTASGQTAHTALQELGVGKGDTVLIHAAAGGVGTFTVQLARAWGATVIGTASVRNHDYLRSLGAIPVAYGDGLVDRVRSLSSAGVDVEKHSLSTKLRTHTEKSKPDTVVEKLSLSLIKHDEKDVVDRESCKNPRRSTTSFLENIRVVFFSHIKALANFQCKATSNYHPNHLQCR